MTNETLIVRRAALQDAASAFQTVRARYAILTTLGYTQDALEGYSEMLKTLLQEHDVSLSADGGLPDDAPPAFLEDLHALMAQDAGTPRVHAMPEDVLALEDKRGSDIPIDVLAQIAFMIE